MKNRNLFIDIVKGYGILFVVLGHNWFSLNQKGELFSIIFSFHLPLFFFISGIFFNDKKSFLDTVASKSKSLLKPYFGTLLLLGLYNIVFNNDNFNHYEKLIGMLYGNGLTIHWEPLWFLTHLFVVILAMWLLSYIFKKFNVSNIVKDLLIVFIFFAGVQCLQSMWMKNVFLFDYAYAIPGLPFSIDILPTTIFYFYLGSRFRYAAINFKPSSVTALTALVAFAALHYFSNYTIDLNLRIYDNFYFSTVGAFCGIYLIFYISHCTTYSNRISNVLSVIGKASLFILVFHGFIQRKFFSASTVILAIENEIAAVISFAVAVAVPTFIYTFVHWSTSKAGGWSFARPNFAMPNFAMPAVAVMMVLIFLGGGYAFHKGRTTTQLIAEQTTTVDHLLDDTQLPIVAESTTTDEFDAVGYSPPSEDMFPEEQPVDKDATTIVADEY